MPGCPEGNPCAGGSRRRECGVEIQEQVDDVLALQDVPFESETTWDDTEAATQDAIVWGDWGWCRFTK